MGDGLFKMFSRSIRAILGLCFVSLIGISQPVLADAVNYIEKHTDNIDGVLGLSGISDVAVSTDGKFVYTASYASSAVSVFERDLITGQLIYRSRTTGISAAFSVDVSNDNKSVYAASPGGMVYAYSRNLTTGELTLVNSVGTNGGTAGFVSVSVSPDSKHVYGVGGSPSGLVVFERDQDTGAITVLHDYKDNTDGYDLGQLYGPQISPIKNIVTSANGLFVYVTSTADNAITLFSRNVITGALTQVAVYKDGVDGVDGIQSASSAKRSPDGKHLYVTGQGEHSVAVFSIDSTTGELTYLDKMTNGVGVVDKLAGARSLAVSPDGRYVLASAITDSSVNVFVRNATTGLLTLDSVVTNNVNSVTGLNGPSGMSTDPLNRHLYVAGQLANSLVVFSLPTPAINLSTNTAIAEVQGAAVTLDNMLEIVDADSNNLLSAAVSVENGFISTDKLAVQTIAGISAAYDSATGVLALSGTASLADYQAVLRTITYQAGADPSLESGESSFRTIGLQVTDEDGNTSATVNINVTVEKSDVIPAILSFNSQGGTAVANIETAAGASVTLPAAPEYTGYSFTGWNTAADGSGTMYSVASSFVMPAVDTTLYAQWAVNQFTLTFDSAGGSVVAPISANFGSAIVAPAAPTREGYIFTGWLPAVPVTMPAQNMTLTAVYTQTMVTVTAIVTGEASVSPASQKVPYGGTATVSLILNNADDVVRLSSSDNCAAALSGGFVVTAALRADCAIAVSVYPNTNVERDSVEPLVSNAVALFRFVGGAGDKRLTQVSLLRSGIDRVLEQTDAEALLTIQADGSYLFSASRTGRYTIEFIDQVSAELVQVTFDVLPYLAFTASSQKAQKGQDATVGLWLSDEPIDYPVTATLGGEGITLQQTTIKLKEADNLRQAQKVTTGSDISAATVQLIKSDSALIGTPAVQQLHLQDTPVVLPVSISARQNNGKTRVVTQTDGLVTLEAIGIADSYQWQVSDITLQADGNIATFNPQTLASGLYHITVNAQTTAGNSGSYELALRIIDTCPVDDCSDLSQGIPASVNAFAETPNRLAVCPSGTGANRTHECEGESNASLYIEVPNLYQLTLGSVSSEQSWQSGQFGLALTDDSLPADEGFVHHGVVVNFDVDGITAPGEVVPVAIPLLPGATIPADALWRKFIGGQWQDFVVDDANRIDSAARDVLGRCPGVSSDSWTTGLTAGHGCIRLLIEDGGPNDEDGEANGVIRDPGVLAVVQAAPEPEPTQAAKVTSGGAAGAVMAGLLGTLVLWRRKAAVAALLLPLGASANGFYSGADVLAVSNDTSNGEVAAGLSRNGLSGTASVSDKSRTGFRVYGGYGITDWLSAEVAWLDAGKIHTTFSGLPADTTVDQLSAIRPASGEGAEVSIVLQPWTLADHFKPGLRIGVWRMKHTDNYQLGNQSVRHSDTDTVAVVELLGEYQLTPDWSVKAGISHYDVDNGAIRSAQLGVKYRF